VEKENRRASRDDCSDDLDGAKKAATQPPFLVLD
jgi:hypothetical protein